MCPTSSSVLVKTGQVSTYQLASQQAFGVAYKITPETTETEKNVMKCFQVNGTKDEAVQPQGTLPDLQGFQVCSSSDRAQVVFRSTPTSACHHS